jgi:hypothetical protein
MSEPCTACLEGRCVLHERGRDPNTFDLCAMFGRSPSMDLLKSVPIWRQQAADETEERARMIREIEEGQERARQELADRIQRGERF